MDNNNNPNPDIQSSLTFYLKNIFGIFYQWFYAILITLFPSLIKKKSVDNKIILITGAGSGIGQLLCVKFAKLNAVIVAWDINDDGLNKTKELVEKAGSKCFIYNVDVTNRNLVYQTANQVKNDVGVVYMLINNAGIVIGKNFLDLKDEEIERTMNVNAMSHFWTCKAFLPGMMDKKHGHIVSISSLAGTVGSPKLTDYCASKFAAVGFEESLRLELFTRGFENIKSTIVLPWYINTGMFSGVKALIPLLEPDFVADKIINACLIDQMVLCLPKSMYLALIAKSTLPTEAAKHIMTMLGADVSMNYFIGRKKVN